MKVSTSVYRLHVHVNEDSCKRLPMSPESSSSNSINCPEKRKHKHVLNGAPTQFYKKRVYTYFCTTLASAPAPPRRHSHHWTDIAMEHR